MVINSKLVLNIMVKCENLYKVGKVESGELRVIPIIGGEFKGDNIEGEVLSGGFDFNTKIDDDVAHVLARYILKTKDNCYITVKNEGYISDRNYNKKIKTVIKFKTDKNSKYKWLTEEIFVGALEVIEGKEFMVEIKVYQLD